MFRNILLFIFIIYTTPSFAAEPYESSYNEGVKSFKQKKYKAALLYFQKAVTQGMKNKSLFFNLGVTYYKLGDYKNSEINFRKLIQDKNFGQIAAYNLGLVAEKRNQRKTAINWYSIAVNNNSDSKITQLANIQLDRLLNRKTTQHSKTNAHVNIAFGNDNNITSTTSNSPSNKRDNYFELFANIKTPVSENVNFNGTAYSINYSTYSTENFLVYSGGLDYIIKKDNWKIIPEFSLTQSTYNYSNYQNIVNIQVAGEHKLNSSSRILLAYRYSDIKSQNSLYNYLQGTRHQMRADYKNNTSFGKLRIRYQLELNDRLNTSTANYSPARHEVRIKLNQTVNRNWNVSEEFGVRSSKYGTISGFTRSDTRTRILLSVSKNVKRNLDSGIRYTYTKNNSNLNSENYSKNNIQIFAGWSF